MNLIKQRQAMKLVKSIKKKVEVKQQSVNFQDVFYNHVDREFGYDEKCINAENQDNINAEDQEETHTINS